MTPALELRDIRVRFGGAEALAGASLAVTAGTIHGLVGANGAGKSTLLKVLSGVLPAGSYRGTVEVLGRKREFRSPVEARAAGVAMVHQELVLVPELTVAQNLFLGREGGRFGLLDDALVERRARDLLRRLGMDDALDPRARLGDLGVGQRQIVEIARALGESSRILVLDEPTAALTTREAERLFSWLRSLRQRGTACVYVSHRLDEILTLCDVVTVLRDGRTVAVVPRSLATVPSLVELIANRRLVPNDVEAPAPRATSPRLRIRSLSLRPDARSSRAALSDIDLEAGPGEIIGLAGALGAGRTALLSVLFGCARGRWSGSVELEGKPFAPRSPREAMDAGVALVPEDRKEQGVVLSLSVRDNLVLARGRRGGWLGRLGLVDDDEDEAEALRLGARLALKGKADDDVGHLSGGNQQKVALGKWLPRRPRLLLLDEPTRGVDVGARDELYTQVRALADAGTTVVFASSDGDELRRLAQRVVVLRDGRITSVLRPSAAEDALLLELCSGASRPDAPAASAREQGGESSWLQ